MNNYTKFIYAFIMVIVFTVATTSGQCPPNTWSLNVTINPDQYPEETSWYIMNFWGDTLMQGGTYDNIVDYEPQYASACAPIDSFYFVISDTYGDGVAGSLWGGNDGSVYIEQCGDTIWTLPVADFGNFLYDTIYTSGCPPPPPIFGCMDSSYVEFDLTATLDTGMCFTPKIYGCTDSTAYNYVVGANTDINIDSCLHELELTDLAGNGWAGSSLKVQQATSLIPPFNYVDIGTFTLLDGFDTTFFFNLQAGYKVKAVFEITQQSDFTAVQCGYKLYSGDYVAIDIEGGFVNPIPPFFPIIGNPYCGNQCIERTYGCTDSTALNYIDTANTDDGSCYYYAGCTNPLYLEYDSIYDYDDGSCQTLIVLGCMDSTALNYNPNANVEIPNSCIEVVEGCTDNTMFNYNVNANVDDGSCIPFIYGCTDVTAFNYDSLANTDDGSCTPVVWGCTDGTAFNYNPLANTDDGSCVPVIFGCTDNTMFNYNPLANTDNGSCEPFVYGCMDSTMFNYNPTANVDNNSCIAYIYGCTDPSALNYNPQANTEDFSCIDYVYGCTDSTALNYDAQANTDNGTCIYPIYGCTDLDAENYNSLANVSDSSCYYSAGCSVGDIYYIPNECFEWVIDVDNFCCDVEWDNTCDYLYQYCVDGWTGTTDIQNLRTSMFQVYPNPTKGTVFFTDKVNVKVYDAIGSIIIDKENVTSININKKGIYMIAISYKDMSILTKIIKN